MQFEIDLIKFIQSGQNKFFDGLFWLLSMLGSWIGGAFVCLLVFFVYKKRFAIWFLATLIFNAGLNYFFKYVINRPRPYEVSSDIINSLQAIGKSFPSGHMVSSTTITFFVLYLICSSNKIKKPIKIISVSVGVLFVLGVAYSRMYLGQHYLTDLIAGILIALTMCFISIRLYYYTKKCFDKKVNK